MGIMNVHVCAVSSNRRSYSSVERLAEMGKWLRLNGEAFFATESLKQYKEGDHIRYTRSKDRKTVYAIILQKPGKTLTIRQVTPAPGAVLKMPGVETPLVWKTVSGGVEISMPEQLPGDYAWVVAIPQ
jgi:alpha-L-fucosidase